jgi:hypothetical protein
MRSKKKITRKTPRKKARRTEGQERKVSFTLPKRKAGRPPSPKGRLARLEAGLLRALAEIAELKGSVR